MYPRPSWPSSFSPQQNRLPPPAPAALIAHVWDETQPDITADHWPTGKGVMEADGVIETVAVTDDVTEIVGVIDGVTEMVGVMEMVTEMVGVMEGVRDMVGLLEGVMEIVVVMVGVALRLAGEYTCKVSPVPS